jgi:large subunit ribosomal protein L6
MSRIGKQAVVVPNQVEVAVQGGLVSVKGPKGALSLTCPSGTSVAYADGRIQVSCFAKSKQARADYGTTRALVLNMVRGVSKGWSKKLLLNGVGYQAKQTGNSLVLIVGYSHEVNMEVPANVVCRAGGTTIELESADRDLLGMFAAKIRDVAPPEPYLGKGIRYDTETVRRKAGKTGKGK